MQELEERKQFLEEPGTEKDQASRQKKGMEEPCPKNSMDIPEALQKSRWNDSWGICSITFGLLKMGLLPPTGTWNLKGNGFWWNHSSMDPLSGFMCVVGRVTTICIPSKAPS